MVIECSSCHARFKLADDKVKDSGTKVRCAKCSEVFTVFPESPLPIISPVIVPAAVVASPASEEDDWNQEKFSDGFFDDAGSSDLDAISFDNIETPVFSITTEKNSKFEFADDTAFSFNDSPTDGKIEPQFQITEPPQEQNFAGEEQNDFDADSYQVEPSISAPEDLNPINADATDNEFSFSEKESPSDFSWDESESSPAESFASESTPGVPPASEDKSFDFNSFSFDDGTATTESEEKEEESDRAFQSEPSHELSTESTTTPSGLSLASPPPPETPEYPQTSSAPRNRDETFPPADRQLRPRPRSRQKKTGSTRAIFKILFLISLLLAIAYGVINRDQLQREYKNRVSSFIDKQTVVETSGKIGLEKLSGGNLVNKQGEDLFVIQGEAINEFKELRSSVLVRGSILDENGAILQSQSAYCGNPLKDSNLKKLGFKEIRNIMNNELGENLVNMNIAPGKSVPFTIVFDTPSKNIKEFTVEVLDSKPGSSK